MALSIKRIVSKNYDEKPTVHHKFNYRISKKYIQNKSIIDVGCWTGQYLSLAKKDAKSISGIDVGEEAINYTRKKIPQGKFKVGNALKIPFKNKSFEVATLLDVIEHIPLNTETKAIKEIKRILNKKGVFIISTPNNNLISIMLDPAFFLIGHRHYSLENLRTMLENNGFKIIKTYFSGGLFTLISHNLDLIFKHILRKKFNRPHWLIKKVAKEYDRKGFAEIHIIAQKI